MSTHAPAAQTTLRLGNVIAMATSVLTTITFVIAILTPPLSGSNCKQNCFEYPYTDIASRFPRDYYWMYPAMLLTLLFVALMVCIHQYAAADKKVFGQIGLSFGIIAAAILLVDYFVQVSVIQPSLEKGEFDGIPLLTQFNPHGVFIALEDIGYLMMSLALACVVPVFSGITRTEKALRWMLGGGFALTVAGLIVVWVTYGIDRGYRFEVITITIDWAVLIVGGILLGSVFRRAMHAASVKPSPANHDEVTHEKP